MNRSNVEIWNEIFKEKDWGQYPALSVVRFAARNFYNKSPRKKVRVLELGCGTGANLWYLAREGFTVYGIDISSEAIKKLKIRFEEEDLNSNIGKISAGSCLDEISTYEDEFFDAIIDVECLCCISFADAKATLSEAVKKLKKTGLILSQTFSENTWGLNGAEVDYHRVIPKDGPAYGQGAIRFTTLQDVKDLYEFETAKIISLELNELTLSNNERISERIVTVERI
jgi:2-polyprenyl-3-methyl-5-hydroxy-6-metoxy-1,4-benzoquinol methylase